MSQATVTIDCRGQTAPLLRTPPILRKMVAWLAEYDGGTGVRKTVQTPAPRGNYVCKEVTAVDAASERYALRSAVNEHKVFVSL